MDALTDMVLRYGLTFLFLNVLVEQLGAPVPAAPTLIIAGALAAEGRVSGLLALAVAVGSSHAMTERVATIDLELIARLAAAVPVPLVLHGSSGVPDETIVRGIRSGLVKVNVSTHLNGGFTGAVRAYLTEHPAIVDSRKYVSAGRAVVRDEAARLLSLFASAGTVHEKEPA